MLVVINQITEQSRAQRADEKDLRAWNGATDNETNKSVLGAEVAGTMNMLMSPPNHKQHM